MMCYCFLIKRYLKLRLIIQELRFIIPVSPWSFILDLQTACADERNDELHLLEWKCV